MTHHHSVFFDVFTFIGRILVSQLFIFAGFSKIVNFQSTVAAMVSVGVPLTEFMLVLAIIFELGGGLLLLFGYYTRFSAVLLFIFVVMVNYYFHSYWAYEAATRVANMQHFMKNLSIIGGLCYVFSAGAGRWSLDKLFRNKC